MPRPYSFRCPDCGSKAFQLSGADGTGRTATCIGCGSEWAAAEVLVPERPAVLPRLVPAAER